MASKFAKTVATRRDRRLAKQSNYRRAPKNNNSKVGHGAGKHPIHIGSAQTQITQVTKDQKTNKYPIIKEAFKEFINEYS